jgi:hypothetical protein
MVKMLVRMAAAHARALHLCGVEVKDPRFVMVDPYQCVVVLTHGVALLKYHVIYDLRPPPGFSHRGRRGNMRATA